jgi:hypothetical protein
MTAFAIIAPKIVFILGIINLLTGLTLYFSCRCIPMGKRGKQLMQKEWFKKYYKYHCVIWKIFWPSVIIHIVLAIMVFRIPF